LADIALNPFFFEIKDLFLCEKGGG
jgi:hypothetical protein